MPRRAREFPNMTSISRVLPLKFASASPETSCGASSRPRAVELSLTHRPEGRIIQCQWDGVRERMAEVQSRRFFAPTALSLEQRIPPAWKMQIALLGGKIAKNLPGICLKTGPHWGAEGTVCINSENVHPGWGHAVTLLRNIITYNDNEIERCTPHISTNISFKNHFCTPVFYIGPLLKGLYNIFLAFHHITTVICSVDLHPLRDDSSLTFNEYDKN